MPPVTELVKANAERAARGCKDTVFGDLWCPGDTVPQLAGWNPFGHGLGPEIGGGTGDPGNRQLPVTPPPAVGSSSGNATGSTGGGTTSPLDALAASLMSGGGGGGFTAAPVTVPAAASGIGMGTVLLLLGVAALGVVLWQRSKKGKAKP